MKTPARSTGANDHLTPSAWIAPSSGSPHATATSSAAGSTENWVTFFGDLDGTWGSYVMREDGSGLRKVPGKNDEQIDAAWSPDGRTLALADGDELVITSPDGTYRHVVPVGGPGQRFAWPAWSPDGKQIVATVCPGRSYCAGELHIVDVATGTSRYLADGQSAGWHPDGRRVAYVHIPDADACRGGIDVFGLTKLLPAGYCLGNLRQLDLVTGEDEALGQFGGFPRYSPDGTVLMWERYNGPEAAVDIVVAQAGDLKRWRALTGRGMDYFPAWTPDGRITFNREEPLRLGARIWMMNADGSNLRALQPITSIANWSLFPNVARRTVG